MSSILTIMNWKIHFSKSGLSQAITEFLNSSANNSNELQQLRYGVSANFGLYAPKCRVQFTLSSEVVRGVRAQDLRGEMFPDAADGDADVGHHRQVCGAQLLARCAVDVLRHAAVGAGGNSFMFSRPSCHNGCFSLQI